MPFSNYDYHVWSNLQQQDKQSMHDRVNGMLHEQRSFSIAILQRISIERLSLSAEKVSLLDDLQLTNKDDGVRSAQGAAGKGTRIGNRGRQLSSTLNDIYSQLNDVAPPHEDEAKEDYLKRIFSIVDSQGMGKVSSMQLTNSLFNDANRASTTVMMTAADHDKDGYLSESEFVSFLINTESGGDCLQADRNEPKPTQSNPTSTRNDAMCDALGSLSAQQTAQKDAHHLTALNDIHMHGIEVTNLCSQSSRIKCIALSPDGKLYAVAHRHDSVAHVYMISNGAEVRRLVGHQGPLLSIIFSPDRKHVMTAARDNFMVSWDHTVGLECSFSEHPGIVTAVAVSCDSQFVFSGCQDNLVRRITASKAKIRAVLPHIPCKTPGVIVALATQSTKNDVVAFSRSCDQCAYIANAKNLQLVAQLTGHESLVWKASFNADDSMLLTCCERKIIVWDGTDFSSVRIFSSVVVATPGSADEVLWTTAVFASQEHCNLLFCFNSVGQMHVLDCDAAEMEESIIDIQMRSSVYTTSIFVGDTMVCGDNYGNVYRVRIT
ncbi:WD domain, G-beta repeat, putative [Leishmania lindenbergi]|uniref:WD domain, G-beta repeat n=1 Tax=Leishmania lindenbergi TaxID=651832 RepID=A0AAW3AZK3_9TRYP